MILLDTHAILWMNSGHRRARPLGRVAGRLYISPVSLLEIQFLTEAGRVRFSSGHSVRDLARNDRWTLDDPPLEDVVDRSLDFSFTRDPFDRLLAAHAQMRRFRLGARLSNS